jgi:hypothetical protein
MFPSRLRMALAAAVLPAALGWGVSRAGEGDRAANAKPGADLSPAEFEELKPLLDIKNQPWTTIPWKYSITEARRLAAATRKPIFMVVNTGNALGCT